MFDIIDVGVTPANGQKAKNEGLEKWKPKKVLTNDSVK